MLIKGYGELQVRPAAEADFDAICQLDLDAYGDYYIGPERFREWFTRYPHGNFVLELNGEVAGLFGIYPLNADNHSSGHHTGGSSSPITARLLSGSIDEEALSPEDMCQPTQENPAAIWYVSDWTLRQDLRKRAAALGHYLLLSGLQLWAASEHVADTYCLLAFGYTTESSFDSRREIKRNGMVHIATSPKRQPLFIATYSKTNAQKFYEDRMKRILTILKRAG